MKNRFPLKLKFKEAGYKHGSLLLQLTHRFEYHCELFGGVVIKVPRFFITDGASIPKPFWSFLSPFGEYFPAAVVHDFLYSKKNTKFDRKQSDKIFLQAMKDKGVILPKRILIWSAVRSFGWAAFHKK